MPIKLIASDLDGTIIDTNNQIFANNFDAITTIHNKNIPFAICTGKTYSITKDLCKQFNAQYGIFGNGSQIINLQTGEEILRNILKKDDVIHCINIARENNLHVHLYTENEIITEKLMYMDLRNFEINKQSNLGLNFKLVPDIREYALSTTDDIFKTIISSEKNMNLAKKQLEECSNFSVTLINKTGQYKDCVINKDYMYLDISPKNINKSFAINYLSNYLNLKNEDILSIGDNLNDLDMVKNSGIGVAVGDAYQELKNVATYTTEKTAQNGAFAEAIFKFIEK